MKFSTVASRLAAWKPLVGLSAVAFASLALASGATAAVVTVSPDGNSGTDNLTAAINALPSSAAYNIIVLHPGRYTPAAPITISGSAPPLTIVANRSAQATGASNTTLNLQNDASKNPSNPWLTISSGAQVTFEGVQISSGGTASAPVISNSGTLTIWNGTIGGSGGTVLNAGPSSTSNITDSTITGDSSGDGINASSATLTLKNSDVTNMTTDGIDTSGGTTTLDNTLVAVNGGSACNIGGTLHVDDVEDDDGTCLTGTNGTQSSPYSPDTNLQNYENSVGFPGPAYNGGPTATEKLPVPGSGPTNGDGLEAGDTASCTNVDQRFFLIPAGVGGPACNVGAVTNAATQETTGPQCRVTNTNEASNPATQTVTITDPGGGGLGPEAGAPTDLFQPAATFNSSNVNPADVVTDLALNNATLAAFTPTAGPTTGSVQIEAQKTNQSALAQWHFWATNWAGVSTYCN